ncbi:MAG: LicD family protein [Clostridia bacterium]|nr:LicD family protein [Clostridia bacterium]
MNQYFCDELKCIFNELAKKKCRPRAYAAKNITVVCDEHSLAAYLAGYYTSVCNVENGGAVNIVAEGEWQNKELYDEINVEFSEKATLECFDNYEQYKENISADEGTVFYIANLQLEKYSDPAIFEKKKKNLAFWLESIKETKLNFVLIPIFNFKEPFPHGIAACSERELEAVTLYDSSFVQGKQVIELEDICRRHFTDDERKLKVVRFDTIFGPLVKDTSKLGFDSIIDELINDNRITFRRSDVFTYYTACYIRQAVSAVHCVSVKGRTGNIYNAANYRFTLHDIKNNLYKSFNYRKPEIVFDDSDGDLSNNNSYECLSNLKIKDLGWTIVTPLQEAIYRTALAMTADEYQAGFYVSIYQGKLERIKQVEMDIIKEIDRICKANGINYFLVGGSLLGGVRHKGFIPWDDDIDIGMLREDYNKFKKICPGELSDKMRYQSYSQEPQSHYIFEKIRLKETYFSTKFSNRFRDIENGIFVDVLVYDKTSNIKLLQKLHVKLIKIMSRVINVRWVNKPRKNIHYKATKLLLPVMRLIPFRVYHWCFEAVLRMFNWNKKSKYLIDGVGQNVGKGAFPISWFDEMTEIPYEDMTFSVPAKYDEYLRHWYGDRYMELLPISSRKSGHSLKRMDLGKYLFAETENLPSHINDHRGELYEKPLDE